MGHLPKPIGQAGSIHHGLHLDGVDGRRDWEAFGTWVHYPWSNRLVRLLPEEAFIEVRTNRNRNKISAEETAALRQKTVGVVGLSVGQATAIALAMERGCGRLKLADFDVVELSNMNRIRCGLHELDLPKWVVAARTIAEFDPFVEVEPFDEGLSAETMDAFLEGCDVVIDACDSLGMKAQLRMACKSRQLPVVMDTNDRGMIDVERYDVLRCVATAICTVELARTTCARLPRCRVGRLKPFRPLWTLSRPQNGVEPAWGKWAKRWSVGPKHTRAWRPAAPMPRKFAAASCWARTFLTQEFTWT